MDKQWIELRIAVPSCGVDLVCSELADLGSDGITVEERPLDTFVPPDPDEVVSDTLVLKAYFPQADDTEALRSTIRDRLAALSPLIPGFEPALPEIAAVRNEDWAEGWKQHFSAVRIGRRLVIKPTWEDFSPLPGDAVVNLDPGMAFGTGTHGTTRLCLEALASTFEETNPPCRVLDVGTGSGILAIAAAALGAQRALGCDIDAESCRTAAANARLNGVSDRVEITRAPLEELEDGFDVVLANILAEENARLAAQLVRRLAPQGVLILSGILREKEQLVIDAFSTFGLSGPEISHFEDWSCLLYRREG